MRTRVLSLSGLLVVVVIAAVAMTHAFQVEGQIASDVEEILSLHRELLDSHIRYDVASVLASESDPVVVVSRGEVRFPTRAERLSQYERYLTSVEFEEYGDLISPIVKVSKDGTLGWLIAQVRIAGTQANGDDAGVPFDAVWAWIELYEKQAGRWIRIGEVSSLRPANGS